MRRHDDRVLLSLLTLCMRGASRLVAGLSAASDVLHADTCLTCGYLTEHSIKVFKLVIVLP